MKVNRDEMNVVIKAISSGVFAIAATIKAINDIIQDTTTWNWSVVIPLAVASVAVVFLVIYVRKYFELKNPYVENTQPSANNDTFSKSKAEIICIWFDDYIANGEGKQYMKTVGDADEQNFKIKQMHKSLNELKNKNNSGLLDSKLYYLYIFALLHGAQTRVWAVSLGDEWEINPQENEFLRMNFEVARRKVELERIFVVTKNKVSKLISNKHVMLQIEKNDKYFHTWIVFKEDIDSIDPNIYRSLGCGFLAFDAFAVADDSFDDVDVRGYIYTQHDDYQKYSLRFSQLRRYVKSFDMQFVNKWQRVSSCYMT